MQALEDVFTRMTKRLTTAAGSKVKRHDQLVEFRNALESSHLSVITSAMAPIIPLCGGDDAGPFAEMLLTEFRSRLDTLATAEDLPASIAALAETFVGQSREFATAALGKMAS